MQKLKKSTVPKEEQQTVIEDMYRQWQEKEDPVWSIMKDVTSPIEAQSKIHQLVMEEYTHAEVYLNDTYQVAKYPEKDGTIHLSIKRIDREPVTDWRDKQAIKNQLVGEQHEAVELYPAEDRVVDTANQYHLWVSADPNYRIPLGWETGIKSESPIGKSKQRKRK